MARPSRSRQRPTDGDVARAALSVLEREPLTALSFRRVASLLGTSHMAVHRHCVSFEGMLEICAEHLALRLPDVDPSLPWTAATEQRFTALYETMAAHSGLVALLRGRPWMGPNMMRRFSEPAVKSSVAAGLTPPQIMQCHFELFVFTVGCALAQSRMHFASGTAAVEALDADDSPAIVAHRKALMDVEHSDHRMFIHGLRTLIASWDPAEDVGRRKDRHGSRRVPRARKRS
jgi:AcrR family transcriptional regulator